MLLFQTSLGALSPADLMTNASNTSDIDNYMDMLHIEFQELKKGTLNKGLRLIWEVSEVRAMNMH